LRRLWRRLRRLRRLRRRLRLAAHCWQTPAPLTADFSYRTTHRWGDRRGLQGLPFFIGGEDCFCTRETAAGQYGALDRKAIMDAELSLMMAEGPAIVADHAFTTGKIAQSGFEKPLGPSRDRPIAPDLNSPYC